MDKLRMIKAVKARIAAVVIRMLFTTSSFDLNKLGYRATLFLQP
jgi:hypothetical protein